MADSNPLWGAPRIHGELLKLGLKVSQATVAKYMPRRTTPPSQTWRTFLANHVHQIAAADFFVVPTSSCRLLFVLVILVHERRRVVHVAVTDRPTAAWTAQQLREAFPWDEAPRYLVRDRDTAFAAWATTAAAIGINDVMTAPHSPWQNAYAERLIGSIRRECLDHVIVANETGPATRLARVPGVLSEVSNALVLGQGCTGLTTYRAAWRRHDRRNSAPRRSPPPLRTPRRVTHAQSPTGNDVSGTPHGQVPRHLAVRLPNCVQHEPHCGRLTISRPRGRQAERAVKRSPTAGRPNEARLEFSVSTGNCFVSAFSIAPMSRSRRG